MLNKKAIREFKEIWKNEFGEEVSDEKAEREGKKLLRFFRLIYRPIPKAKA